MAASFDFDDSINIKNFEKELENIYNPVIIFFEKELQKVRTNRAHPSLIEDTKVYAYSEYTSLKDIALISAPESTTLVVEPFDKSILSDIEKALSQEGMGLNPKNDGKNLKINLPPMSKERRDEIIKNISKKKEEIINQARHKRKDILNDIKKAEKNKRISKDTLQKLQKSSQLIFDKTLDSLEIISKKKKNQIKE